MLMIESVDVKDLAWFAPGWLWLLHRDGRLVAFDTTARRTVYSTTLSPRGPLTTVAFAPNGRWLTVHPNLRDLNATVDAVLTGTTPIPEPVVRNPPGDFFVDCLYAFTPDCQFALRNVSDLADIDDQQLLRLPDLDLHALCPRPAVSSGYAAALSERFVVWYTRRFPPCREAAVLALDSGKVLATLKHTQGIRAVTFSPDGTQLATAAAGIVCVWNPETGECLRKFKAQRGSITALAFDPSGTFLAVACPDESVRFWDVASGKELCRFAWEQGPTSELAFAPDGSTIAAITPQSVVVWDVDV